MLSNKEKAELTYKQLQERKRRRAEGSKQAEALTIENTYKVMSKNRVAKGRGARSL